MATPRARWLKSLLTALAAAPPGDGLLRSRRGRPASRAPPMLTSLIGAALAEPVPVPATDGRTHLAYELQLTNTLSGNVTLQSLTVANGNRPLLTLDGVSLKYLTRALGNTTVATNVPGPGQSALVGWMWRSPAMPRCQPTTHLIHLSVDKPPRTDRQRRHPDVAPVRVSTHKTVSISPPLDGPNWLTATAVAI